MTEGIDGGNFRTGDQCSSIIAGERLDFIGQVLCPLKARFKEGYDRVALERERRTGRPLRSYVPTVCGGGEKPSEGKSPGDVLRFMGIADFPDMAASFDYGDYFSEAFRDRFLGRGHFEAPPRKGVNRNFSDSGLDDPEGEYYVYGGYPIVFLVDREKLRGRPVPRTWRELLDPIYRKDITISGGHGRVGASVPMHMARAFGEEAIERLDRNVARAIHPSEMARLAGSGRDDGTAIYTIMGFFGKARGEKGDTELVWPDDGAIFDPAFFLLKKGKLEEYRDLVEYVAGAEFGRVSASNGFPAAHPEVDNGLGSDARLQWLGWDFLRSTDMDAFKQRVTAPFVKYLNA
jgi:ABC-type Fe3+ transport system substrate-binding protein